MQKDNQNVPPENKSHFLKEIEINNVISQKNSTESASKNLNNIKETSPSKCLFNSNNKNNSLDNMVSNELRINKEENSQQHIQVDESRLADEVNEQKNKSNNIETQQTRKSYVPMEVECITPINNLKDILLDENHKDEEVIDMLNDFVDS